MNNQATVFFIAGIIFCFLLVLLALFIKKKLEKHLIPYQKGKKYWCKVVHISDGDTLTCRRFNLRRSVTKVRFAYIDAPESKQAYGIESARLLKKMVDGKIVRIQIAEVDRYGRHIGVIHRFGRNINEEMLKRGAAWVYEDYIKDKNELKRLQELQAKAKKQKKGLWKNTRAVHPSVFRNQSRS